MPVKPVVKIINDPEIIKTAVELNRKHILILLNTQDMTVSDIADAMHKDISTVYRHVHKLESVGLVEVVGEKKTHHIPEKVYGRTAKIFLYSPEAVKRMEGQFLEEHAIPSAAMLLDRLREMGYEVDGSAEFRDNFARMLLRFNLLATGELQNLSSESDREISISMHILIMLVIGLINLDIDPEIGERVKRFLAGVELKDD